MDDGISRMGFKIRKRVSSRFVEPVVDEGKSRGR